MLYGLSNILKRETREGRQESMTSDQEGAALDLSDEMAQTGRFVFRQFLAAHHWQFPVCRPLARNGEREAQRHELTLCRSFQCL